MTSNLLRILDTFSMLQNIGVPGVIIVTTCMLVTVIGNSEMSNMGCRLDPVEDYYEPCSENKYSLDACFPGYKKTAECAGNSPYNHCVPCTLNHYLDFPNNCTSCIPCTVCNSSQYAHRVCSHELDTVCKTLPLMTTPTSPERSDSVSSPSTNFPYTSVQHSDLTSPIHEYDTGGTTACNSVPSPLSSIKPMEVSILMALYICFIQ